MNSLQVQRYSLEWKGTFTINAVNSGVEVPFKNAADGKKNMGRSSYNNYG